MNGIPDDTECIKLLHKVGCSQRVVVHCCTVRAVAEEMLNGIKNADNHLVIAGALLHDIGRSADNTIMHAMVGARIVKELGLPEELQEIVKKHTGAGLDDNDIREYNLPVDDYIPKSLEERIVAHADNLVSGNRVVSHHHAADKLRSYGAASGADRIEKLHWELSKLYGMDLDVIPDIIGEYPKLKGVSH